MTGRAVGHGTETQGEGWPEQLTDREAWLQALLPLPVVGLCPGDEGEGGDRHGGATGRGAAGAGERDCLGDTMCDPGPRPGWGMWREGGSCGPPIRVRGTRPQRRFSGSHVRGFAVTTATGRVW